MAETSTPSRHPPPPVSPAQPAVQTVYVTYLPTQAPRISSFRIHVQTSRHTEMITLLTPERHTYVPDKSNRCIFPAYLLVEQRQRRAAHSARGFFAQARPGMTRFAV